MMGQWVYHRLISPQTYWLPIASLHHDHSLPNWLWVGSHFSSRVLSLDGNALWLSVHTRKYVWKLLFSWWLFWLVLFHQQVVVGPGSILNESRCLMKARPMPKRLWGWKQSADTVLGRRTWLIVKALAPQGFDTWTAKDCASPVLSLGA